MANPISGIVDASQGAAEVYSAVTNRNFWARYGTLLIGLYVVTLGVVVLLASSRAVRSTVSTATKLVATKGLGK